MVCLNESENEPDENNSESRPESMPANKFLNMLLKTFGIFGSNLVFFGNKLVFLVLFSQNWYFLYTIFGSGLPLDPTQPKVWFALKQNSQAI